MFWKWSWDEVGEGDCDQAVGGARCVVEPAHWAAMDWFWVCQSEIGVGLSEIWGALS